MFSSLAESRLPHLTRGLVRLHRTRRPVHKEAAAALAAPIRLLAQRIVYWNGEQRIAVRASHLGLAGQSTREASLDEHWV